MIVLSECLISIELSLVGVFVHAKDIEFEIC